MRDEFSQHLQAATPEQPLVLFLDALDQLADADNGRLLNWLPPGSLPAHVKLVVSCLSDRATGDPAGQRYGWWSEPRHFRDPANRQRQEQEPRSITDLEARHTVLDQHRKRRSDFFPQATTIPEPNVEFMAPPEYQGQLEHLKTAVRHCGRAVRGYRPTHRSTDIAGCKGGWYSSANKP